MSFYVWCDVGVLAGVGNVIFFTAALIFLNIGMPLLTSIFTVAFVVSVIVSFCALIAVTLEP